MADPNKHVQFAESLHKEQLKFHPDQLNVAAGERKDDLSDTAPRTPGVMDEQFPTAALTEYEPEKDREMVAKLKLGKAAQEDGAPVGYTPFGKLEAKDEDFKWYQRKQAAAEVANFQRWFAREFDKMDPAQKKRAKELYPEFYRERKKLLKQQAKNLVRLAKIKLEGVENMSDLQLQYMAETGRLDVGPLEHLLNPEAVKGATKKRWQQQNFVRGLANPFLVFGKYAYPDDENARRVDQQDFASRDYDQNITTRLGFTKGFPPMGDEDGNQGDLQWYQVLNNGLPKV